MIIGDVNVYWEHDVLSPHNVRAATYGRPDTAALLPEVGDIISEFPGWMGEPISVKVTAVREFGQGVQAYMVTVTDADVA